ncbi:hypothetical protein [Cellulosilyticum lentocellum]|uniref:Uncharacterized protein n=1 Tax=Cellulosilyticum lentocellum (strain ATCC 49066 / DSM 5427 / NCIMB 11756 / RHM5) TaxID=642492 RepID=F2JKK4_CELLD|nr:hypothetical protein [Cellulosilyticum lentocellum]ADZ82164.1 hypothetical protein Clole_0421 [Cellulosilyticum lentocellum DSM 5427]
MKGLNQVDDILKTTDDIRYEKYWEDLAKRTDDIPPNWTPDEYQKYINATEKVDAELALKKIDADELIEARRKALNEEKGFLEEVSEIERGKQDVSKKDVYAFSQYKQGLLKEDILSNSQQIISGNQLWDKKAISELTKDGSNINDWSKMSSNYQYDTPYGRGEVHYYQNQVTGEISSFDIKMKIIKSKNLWKDKTIAEYYIVDLDKDFNIIGVR